MIGNDNSRPKLYCSERIYAYNCFANVYDVWKRLLGYVNSTHRLGNRRRNTFLKSVSNVTVAKLFSFQHGVG